MILFAALFTAGLFVLRPEHRPKLSVLLISIDTLRADRLGCYGGPATPHIDGLARRGVLFERAWTPIPVTRPAHATLLTGALPHVHGVLDNRHGRLRGFETLASVLKAYGYGTHAVVAADPMRAGSGLDRGFDRYDDDLPELPATAAATRFSERGAGEVTDRAIRFLERPPDRFLLFVHYFDPHAEYDPPASYRQRYANDLYQGEVAHVDAEIGRLLATLDSRGLMERTIVVLTSDHGEGLGEHGEASHGVYLYESTVRIPLIVTMPRGRRRPGRDRRLASLADVMPTLLARLGVGAPASASGVDLFGPRRRDWLGSESYYGAIHFGWAPVRAARDERNKLIRSAKHRLHFDLEVDPAETRPLASIDEPTRRLLETRLSGPLAAPRRPGGLAPARDLRSLRAAGYPARTPPERFRWSGIDPHDAVHLLAAFQRAHAEHLQGNHGVCRIYLKKVLAADPDNPAALALAARNERAGGRAPEAIVHARRLAAVRKRDPEARGLVLDLLLDGGELESARRTALSYLEDDPGDPFSHRALAFVWLRRGKHREAARHALISLERLDRLSTRVFLLRALVGLSDWAQVLRRGKELAPLLEKALRRREAGEVRALVVMASGKMR